MAATVATAVCDTVTTASPGPTPQARKAKCSASVPLPTPNGIAYAEIPCKLLQKGGNLLRQDITAALKHPLDN